MIIKRPRTETLLAYIIIMGLEAAKELVKITRLERNILEFHFKSVEYNTLDVLAFIRGNLPKQFLIHSKDVNGLKCYKVVYEREKLLYGSEKTLKKREGGRRKLNA